MNQKCGEEAASGIHGCHCLGVVFMLGIGHDIYFIFAKTIAINARKTAPVVK